jgi:hypothetical protein
MKKETIIILRIIITVLMVTPVVIFAFNAFSRPRPVPEVRDVQKICDDYNIISKKEGPFVRESNGLSKADRAVRTGCRDAGKRQIDL